jgi:hypothetical protein
VCRRPYQEHPIIATTGDGGVGISIMELETIAKYRLPAVIIVFNNAWGTWTQASRVPLGAAAASFQENLRCVSRAGARGRYGRPARRSTIRGTVDREDLPGPVREDSRDDAAGRAGDDHVRRLRRSLPTSCRSIDFRLGRRS